MADQALLDRMAELERRIAILEYQQSAAESGASRAAESARLESALGLTWLNRAGAAVLVAGVLLAATWAYDEGYLTPAWRNGLLGAVSVVLSVCGIRLLTSIRDESARFGLGLAIVGVTGTLVTFYSVAHYDELVGANAALGAGAVVAAILFGVGTWFRVDAIDAIAAAAAASLPLLMDTVEPTLSLAIAGVVGLAAVVLQRRGGEAHAVFVAAIAVAGYSLALSPSPALVSAVMALFVGGYVQALVRRDSVPFSPRAAVVLAIAVAVAAWIRQGDHAVAATFAFGVAAVGLVATDSLLIAAATIATGVPLGLAGGAVAQTASACATGLALIAVGVRFADSTVRHVGVGALLLALFKLVVLDLWSATASLRVVVLLVLGSALLAASYLYSRHVRREAEATEA